jgi:hypothetical protein
MNRFPKDGNEGPAANRPEDYREDEVDRIVRECGSVFLLKLREANVRDVALILTSVALVVLGMFQAIGAIRSADAAKTAADIAQDALRRGDRP